MDDKGHKPTIIVSYKSYRPPVNAVRAIEELIDVVPEKYLGGLKSIVLTNSGALNHQRRRSTTRSRGRKVKIKDCLGLYHGKTRGQPIWIELFVDRILRKWPRWLLWIRFFRNFALGAVFYHELGHHVHLTKIPRHREREDVADDWAARFLKSYIRDQHVIFYYLNRIIRVPLNPFSGGTNVDTERRERRVRTAPFLISLVRTGIESGPSTAWL